MLKKILLSIFVVCSSVLAAGNVHDQVDTSHWVTIKIPADSSPNSETVSVFLPEIPEMIEPLVETKEFQPWAYTASEGDIHFFFSAMQHNHLLRKRGEIGPNQELTRAEFNLKAKEGFEAFVNSLSKLDCRLISSEWSETSYSMFWIGEETLNCATIVAGRDHLYTLLTDMHNPIFRDADAIIEGHPAFEAMHQVILKHEAFVQSLVIE